MVEHGFACAVVYGTEHGILKISGSKDISEALSRNGRDIMEGWTSNPENAGVMETKVQLPELPGPLEKLNYHTMRKLLRSLCLIEKGSGEVNWGKEEHRPQWWPSSIPWTSSLTKQGTPVESLRELVKTAYEYYSVSESQVSIRQDCF